MSNTSQFEKHFQTGVMIVVGGVMTWVGTSVSTYGNNIAVLENEIQHLKVAIESVSSDRYTQTEANADNKYIQLQIDDLKVKYADLYARYDSIEIIY